MSIAFQIPDWTENPCLYILFAEQSPSNSALRKKMQLAFKKHYKIFLWVITISCKFKFWKKKSKKKENMVNVTCIQENALQGMGIIVIQMPGG